MSEPNQLSNTKKPVYCYLDVPYDKKEEAKALGAQWDPTAHLWFVPWGASQSEELKKRWLHPYIYIGVAEKECYRCGSMTPVVGFGKVDNGFMDEGVTSSPLLTLSRPPENVPQELREFLFKTCGFQNSWSKTTSELSLHNHCMTPGCNAYQGDFFLYSEVASPFFITQPSDIAKITYFQVPVKWVYGEPYTYDLDFGEMMYTYADSHHQCLYLGITESVMFDMSE